MSSTAERSARYYSKNEGYPVFRVNNVLYKLDPNAISRCSRFLAGLCKAPGPKETTQVSSDENPICLVNVEEGEFEIFCALAYGRPPRAKQWETGSRAIPALLRLLEFGQYFMSAGTKEHALGMLRGRSYFLPAAQLVHIGFHYGSKTLFDLGFRMLVTVPLRELTDQHLNWMGFRAYVALARLKEAIQQHRFILASEKPQFHTAESSFGSFILHESVVHSPLCANNQECGEDWHAVWWN
ncbi:hypothetical protein C8R45DRAFT_1110177 [Mycena sanguinolenta]|nr:hypothetical protein C8R45DRAFT_1110177 [Mycena sanguinolenta]